MEVALHLGRQKNFRIFA